MTQDISTQMIHLTTKTLTEAPTTAVSMVSAESSTKESACERISHNFLLTIILALDMYYILDWYAQ